MAELMFGLGQTRKKKESDAKIKSTRDRLKNVTITETVESIVRSGQHDRDQKYKGTQRETKKNLKNVTQEETGEMAIRKQQSDREKRWKQTGRNQVKTNSKFDMARSLFGGGDPVIITNRDEERLFGKEESGRNQVKNNHIKLDTAPTVSHDEEQSFEEDFTEASITEYSDEYVDEEIIIAIDEDF
jgi:hypothetical protein